MEISQDTNNVVNTVESFTGKQLLKKNDFSTILELAVTHNGIEPFTKALTDGTAFYKLSKKLNKIDPNDSSANNFKHEFERYLELFKAEISTIAAYLDEEQLKERFQKTYFELTRGCVLNLIDLAPRPAKSKYT